MCKREVNCENVVVPTVDELEVWVAMLKTWDSFPLDKKDFKVPDVKRLGCVVYYGIKRCLVYCFLNRILQSTTVYYKAFSGYAILSRRQVPRVPQKARGVRPA